VVKLLGLAGVGMLIALALAYGLSWALSRPIGRLTDAARRVSEGDYMARVGARACAIEELAVLNGTFDQMADNVVRKGGELMAANADLADTNRQYMEMLEFVTHELKSPLSSCLFACDSLREGCFGPMADSQRAVLDTMERNLAYLNEMITNYLNLSRIEKDEMQFDPRVVAVRDEVVLPVLEQIGGQVQATAMRIRCEVPADARVLGDRELLKIVMDNLLSNAVKYGRRDTEIAVRAGPGDAGRVRITVRNEGCGIPEADLPRLFRKFTRLDARELRAKKGTGLGLFITRQIVAAHGGTIGAESQEGAWALFWVDLPAAPPA
jgi:signal transduction histidine kinase